jgi:hypothetical protein
LALLVRNLRVRGCLRARTAGYLLAVLAHSLVVALVVLSTDASAEQPWKTTRTADGLKLETRPVDGSTFEEVKVTTQSEKPLSALCNAVWGRNAKVEGHFKKRVVIRESDTDRWTYEQLKVPIVTDRDVVVHSQLVANADSGRCEVQFEAAEDPEYPAAKGHVRVTTLHGRWTLEPTADGKVDITYVVYGEPGGKIPAWLSRGGNRDAALIFMKTILSRADQQ